MAKLCNAAPAFFRAQPAGTGRNFPRPVVTRRLESLLCCAARALFRLKSVTVVGVKQALTGPRHYTTCSYRDLRESVITPPQGVVLLSWKTCLADPFKDAGDTLAVAIGGRLLAGVAAEAGLTANAAFQKPGSSRSSYRFPD
jgi:hypothetical protein